MRIHFRYSHNAYVLKKSYGNIHVTAAIEFPKGSRRKAADVLRDDMYNLLNDPELESLLTSSKNRRNQICI
jgi:hypothetical protein